MSPEQIVYLVAQVLVIVGAINWGSVAIFNLDFVQLLLGNLSIGDFKIEQAVKALVGLAGLIFAYKFLLDNKVIKA